MLGMVFVYYLLSDTFDVVNIADLKYRVLGCETGAHDDLLGKAARKGNIDELPRGSHIRRHTVNSVLPHQKALTALYRQTVEPTATLKHVHKLVSLGHVVEISVVGAVSAKADMIHRKRGVLVVIFDYVGIKFGGSVESLGGIIRAPFSAREPLSVFAIRHSVPPKIL